MLPDGWTRTSSHRGGKPCSRCGGSSKIRDRALGDEYLWSHRKRSFDSATRPIYVDTGVNVVRLHTLGASHGTARIGSYKQFCTKYGLAIGGAIA